MNIQETERGGESIGRKKIILTLMHKSIISSIDNRIRKHIQNLDKRPKFTWKTQGKNNGEC